MFQYDDGPEDGVIDRVEFEKGLIDLDMNLEPNMVAALFDSIDSDKDGVITSSELSSSLEDGDAIQQEYEAAAKNAAVTIGAAALFATGIAVFENVNQALDFFTGYIVEISLSVDNLFVFILLFSFFKVPVALQKTCLNYGIIGAIVLRGAFILAGSVLLEKFSGLFLIFGGFLLYSSVASLLKEEGEEEEADFEDNFVLQKARDLLDVTPDFDGANFFTQVDGVRKATPLLLATVCIELIDVVFAVDSIPAIFGVTSDPFIVFTSNIFAIAGLQSLFVILSRAVEDLKYLEKSVAGILGFVGVKLIAEYFGVEFSSGASLGVIGVLLAAGIGASLLDKEEPVSWEERTLPQKEPSIFKAGNALMDTFTSESEGSQ